MHPLPHLDDSAHGSATQHHRLHPTLCHLSGLANVNLALVVRHAGVIIIRLVVVGIESLNAGPEYLVEHTDLFGEPFMLVRPICLVGYFDILLGHGDASLFVAGQFLHSSGHRTSVSISFFCCLSNLKFARALAPLHMR